MSHCLLKEKKSFLLLIFVYLVMERRKKRNQKQMNKWNNIIVNLIQIAISDWCAHKATLTTWTQWKQIFSVCDTLIHIILCHRYLCVVRWFCLNFANNRQKRNKRITKTVKSPSAKFTPILVNQSFPIAKKRNHITKSQQSSFIYLLCLYLLMSLHCERNEREREKENRKEHILLARNV